MKKSHEFPFREQAIVLVATERGILAICNDQIIEEQPLPYSIYQMLLEYQQIHPSIHVSMMTKPMKYSRVLEKIPGYISGKAIESPPRPLVVRQGNEANQTIILTSPVRSKKQRIVKTKRKAKRELNNQNQNQNQNQEVMKNKNQASERALAHTQNVAVGLIQCVFGTAHFALQTGADVVCYSEAKLTKAISSHQESVEEIMAARRAKTKQYQQDIKDLADKEKMLAKIDAYKKKLAQMKREREQGADDAELKTA